MAELGECEEDVRDFLRHTFGMMTLNPDFLSTLPGHTSGHARAEIVLRRIKQALLEEILEDMDGLITRVER